MNTSSNTGARRLQGYKRALSEYGIDLDERLVLESAYYIADAYAAAGDLVTTDATAVFASSDNIALGLLKRLYEVGLRVPRDYSVVSYDNSAADVLFEPALTSIEQNVDELADAALELLFRRLEEDGSENPVPFERRVLTPRLVVKDSVRAAVAPSFSSSACVPTA